MGYISTDLRRIKEEHSDAFLAETNSWIKVFRRAIKVSVGTGWTVQPDRGNIRVLYGTKATGFLSINLPYKWQEDQWVEALKLIETAADTYQNYKSKISLKAAFDISQKSSTKFEMDWDIALENYRNSSRGCLFCEHRYDH